MKHSVIYKMRMSHFEKIRQTSFARHITVCGNKFKHIQHKTGLYNMECIGCKKTYYSSPAGLDKKYERCDRELSVNDPNLLFRSKEEF